MDKPQNMPSVPPGVTVRVVDVARCQAPEPQDMGDALALDNEVVSYRFRWYWALGTPENAA